MFYLYSTIFIYNVYVRSKHLKSQCLSYWKYSKLLCIRTLIKLSYHTSSVEAVHSQVIFSFMITFNCSFLSFSLNFYFTFFFCYCFGTEIFMSKIKSIKLLLLSVPKVAVVERFKCILKWFVPSKVIRNPQRGIQNPRLVGVFFAVNGY